MITPHVLIQKGLFPVLAILDTRETAQLVKVINDFISSKEDFLVDCKHAFLDVYSLFAFPKYL